MSEVTLDRCGLTHCAEVAAADTRLDRHSPAGPEHLPDDLARMMCLARPGAPRRLRPVRLNPQLADPIVESRKGVSFVPRDLSILDLRALSRIPESRRLVGDYASDLSKCPHIGARVFEINFFAGQAGPR